MKLRKLYQSKVFIAIVLLALCVASFHAYGTTPVSFSVEKHSAVTSNKSRAELTAQSIYERDQSLTLGYAGMIRNVCDRSGEEQVEVYSQLKVLRFFIFAMLFGIALFPTNYIFMQHCPFMMHHEEQHDMLDVLHDKDGKKK